MNEISRIAFFPDSYLEVNGVAMTSKRLESFARSRNYPFLCVHGGKKTRKTQDGSVTRLEFKRSPLSLVLDNELAYDPLFQRYTNILWDALKEFRPDVIHITGLNDVSILGAWLSYRMNIPLLASWHTNVHEFAGRRMRQSLNFLGKKGCRGLSGFIERQIFRGSMLYYRMGKVILAPNDEDVSILRQNTKRPTYLMTRGVDTEFFSPEKRTIRDGVIRLGYVGRLRPEKNVRLLADLERELLEAGMTNFEFLVVGDGSDRPWLEQNMKHAKFLGYLNGEPLAEAYANMDIFIFPSETDSFGNVVQEANASGVPSIVTDFGGPKYFTQDGENGFVAKNFQDFVDFSVRLMNNPSELDAMREASRKFALTRTWEAVFEKVYQAYIECREIKPPITKANLNIAPLS